LDEVLNVVPKKQMRWCSVFYRSI